MYDLKHISYIHELSVYVCQYVQSEIDITKVISTNTIESNL